MSDLRPTNCRFRLQDEGKPFPRSSCTACKKTIISGLGKECSFPNGRIPRYRMEVAGEAGDLFIDHIEDENGAWVMFESLSTARSEGIREGLEMGATVAEEHGAKCIAKMHKNRSDLALAILEMAASDAESIAAAIRAKIEEVKP